MTVRAEVFTVCHAVAPALFGQMRRFKYGSHNFVQILLPLSLTETAVDRQISFPLSNVLHANGERNGQPLLHDFTEDIQFMDIEETSGEETTCLVCD